jgi:cysteate synthase
LGETDSSRMANATAEARHYILACSLCEERLDDDGLVLECPGDHSPALLRTEYAEREFRPRLAGTGLFRYREWLPVIRTQEDAGRTAVYRSKALAAALGLSNLWIAFNGYWPERGASLETATFKELEAYTVLGRLPERQVTLAVASSGNTAAAFAWACSQRQIPCLLVVPARGLGRLKFRAQLHPCVSIVAIDGGDYPDAIDLVAAVSRTGHFQAEGGVKNVGRRDGLGTVLLAAFEEMQCLPSYYFQAVGSGTGAIAVLEAAKRLRGSACEPAVKLPRLMLCQNLPFTPIHDAWRTRRRSGETRSAECFRDAVRRVHADELTNWTPPYEIRGGVYDALVESQGDVLAAGNASVRVAMDMFLELEGIDIEPAVGVAVACLRAAAAGGKIDREAVVLLNATGGGRLRLGRDYPLVPVQPRLRLARGSLGESEAAQRVAALCASAASMA